MSLAARLPFFSVCEYGADGVSICEYGTEILTTAIEKGHDQTNPRVYSYINICEYVSM